MTQTQHPDDSVVALVDGSPYAPSVCDHAAWIANGTGAGVELLHLITREADHVPQDLSGAIRLGARTALLDQLSTLDEQRARVATAHGRAILEDAVARLKAAGVNDVETRLRQGDVVEAVAQMEPSARVTIVGKRGEKGGTDRKHLGHLLDRILRAARRPVLVVPHEYRAIKRVLLAWDASPACQRAAERLATSPLFANVPIDLVAVGAVKDLDDVAAALTSAGRSVTIHRREGAVEAELLAQIDASDPDLIVIGASGHSRLRAMFVGSTTLHILQATHRAVLVTR